jgi:tetrahydromethanopterin S-methyltransferase subunit G
MTDEAYLEHKKRMAELEKKIESMKLREYSSIAGSISAILDATAGDNIKRIKAAKIAALGEIAINQGIAIAQAVTSVKGLVFPANIPAIAAAVANALAALVPAIQAVNSVKLARGGHVSGPGTSTSDSVPAMLSNGEFVVNARATSMFPDLLETINNLGLGIASPARLETAYQARQEAMTLDMMIKAFKHLPRPVVSVEEYSRVENRVDTLENLTRL